MQELRHSCKQLLPLLLKTAASAVLQAQHKIVLLKLLLHLLQIGSSGSHQQQQQLLLRCADNWTAAAAAAVLCVVALSGAPASISIISEAVFRAMIATCKGMKMLPFGICTGLFGGKLGSASSCFISCTHKMQRRRSKGRVQANRTRQQQAVNSYKLKTRM
jgi:hypothetical protein